MHDFISKFHADESGAVTVDWVVLTAAVIGLGFGVFALVQSGADGLATNIETELSAATTGDANS